LRFDGGLRTEVLQLCDNIVFEHRIFLGLCEDAGFDCQQSVRFADRQSAFPTSSRLTSLKLQMSSA